jgi:t-SNARE complex subunit (syntaxin)
LSFKADNNDSEANEECLKFLDELENQRQQVATEIRNPDESDMTKYIENFTRDNSILQKKIGIIKSQLDDVNKDNKK